MRTWALPELAWSLTGQGETVGETSGGEAGR